VVRDTAPVGATIEPFVASSGPPADAVDLNHPASQIEALALVNENYASANTLLPIRIDNGVLLGAYADPNDEASLRELQVCNDRPADPANVSTRHPVEVVSRPGRTPGMRFASATAKLVISVPDSFPTLRV